MEITKTVPVTIVVHPKFPTLCSGACPNYGRIKEIGTSYFNSDLGFCHRYQIKLAEFHGRCPECLAEFGTNEKPERQFIIDDEQIWAAILGLQAAIRECEAEANGSDDPEQSQQDCNWFADHLSGLQRLREMPNERPIGTTESNKQEG